MELTNATQNKNEQHLNGFLIYSDSLMRKFRNEYS